jgi:Rrf2 family protein
MILNQTVEYGFRAMACLAIHHGEGPVRSKELAERTSIPSGYLSKVMRRMVIAQLVHSQRGHGGGFTLAREPAEIRFIDLLEALDFELDQTRCAFGIGSCDAANPCPLHDSWAELRSDFKSWARNHTLAQLADGSCEASFDASAHQATRA